MSKRRASMREGPLADLFRATDEAEAAEPAQVSGPVPLRAARRARDEEPLPPPTPLAGARRAPVHARGTRGVELSREHPRRRRGWRRHERGRAHDRDRSARRRVRRRQHRRAAARDVRRDASRSRSAASRRAVSAPEATPSLGKRVAEAGSDRLREALRGSDMVFVAVGEGGGTGSGAAPVVARLARELGALTVAIVTMPFGFEGSRRQTAADLGLERLATEVDTVIVVPNDRLLQVLDRGTSMLDAFRVADDVLRQGVQGICDLITRPGLINLDFADVRTVMQGSGNALMGIGMASGATRGDRRGEARDRLAAARARHPRRERDRAVDRRWRRPRPGRGHGGGGGGPRGRDGRCEHHLRRVGRSRPDGPVLGDRDRNRLRWRRGARARGVLRHQLA